MRKLLLFSLVIVILGMTSCMDVYHVTKKSTFDRAINSVQFEMNNQGFNSIGSSSNTRNETVVTGVSYSRYSGYGSAMANNFITQDTYRFSDSIGNTMSYSVSYSLKQTPKGDLYVDNVEVSGCESSNPKYYNKLCGNESLINRINNLPKDMEIESINTANTALAATVPVILLSVIIVLML